MPCMPSLARVMPVISLFIALFPYPKRLDHDPIRLKRIVISSLCLSMISGQTLRVCPEGKPVPTFPDHALVGRRAILRVTVAVILEDLLDNLGLEFTVRAFGDLGQIEILNRVAVAIEFETTAQRGEVGLL